MSSLRHAWLKLTFYLALLLIIGTSISRTAKAEVIDRIVAVVNDDLITQSDISSFQNKLRKNGLVDDALLNMYDKKALLADGKLLIDYLIDEKTIDSEVRSQGLVSPIEQVESEIRNIARARGIERTQLKQALKTEGIAYSDYQDFIKTSLQRQSLLQKDVTSKIKISDDDINAFYLASSPNSKGLIFEYTLSHILFLAKNGGFDGALARANEVSEKLKQNVPFESLVARHSEDPTFTQGGVFGTFKAVDFNKDVAASITTLRDGELSAPVKMPDGYHIFKVIKRTLVPSPELDARREEIRRHLMTAGFKKHFRQWLDQKRKESYISIN